MTTKARKIQMTEKKRASARKKILPAPKKSLTGTALKLRDVNRRNRFGETLLHNAVLNGDIQLLKDILKLRPNVNMTDCTGRTALHEAALRNKYEACRCLINAGALVNIATHKKVTALHEAITFGNKRIVELLLKHGAKPPLKTKEKETAFGTTEKRPRQVKVAKTKPKSNPPFDNGGEIVGPRETSDICDQEHETSDDDSISLLHGIEPIQSRGMIAGLEKHHLALETITKEQENRMEQSPRRTPSGTEQKNLSECEADSGWAALNVEVVGEPLNAGADINASNHDGFNPLHDVATSGHYQVMFSENNFSYPLDKRADSRCSEMAVHHYSTRSTQETLTTVRSSLTHIMKIRTVHLVADEELIPNAILDSYWQSLLQGDPRLGW
ncbi:serine/threonine-protein phosphatase 6 regulatory ankyrin repeat subunit C-like isoform X2 [Hippocampus comes]|uniref:serine/threonine-protein phosphatase 6 regulatory ankyrin repeat subunit C-like isoform X2 n=1 Tax=Hippocampus comes TaxID=109280 RepID=UPI00094E4A3F|nr:PREDICTED: serine/threonine-protein phosphatase 6 regulatory ankyrin repeat subunit C-like isoform X2 [Hippocampus comes]